MAWRDVFTLLLVILEAFLFLLSSLLYLLFVATIGADADGAHKTFCNIGAFLSSVAVVSTK